MLNSGKKFRAMRDKKINILTLVLSENKTKQKTIPPFKLNGRSLITICNTSINVYIYCRVLNKLLSRHVLTVWHRKLKHMNNLAQNKNQE
jgi:hypothetical protein